MNCFIESLLIKKKKMDLNETMNTSVISTNGSFNASEEGERYYSPLFGIDLSMPEWEALLTILALGLVIIITIIGKNKNFVILSLNHQYHPSLASYIIISYSFLIYRKYFGDCFCFYLYSIEDNTQLLHC